MRMNTIASTCKEPQHVSSFLYHWSISGWGELHRSVCWRQMHQDSPRHFSWKLNITLTRNHVFKPPDKSVLLKIDFERARAHPVTSHCSNLLLKRRAATNISHWLKVQSRWFKMKKCILISFWNFQYWFIIPSHLIIVPYFTLWMLDFFNTIRVSNSLDPDQARHFVGPDLGPNCLLSRQQKSPLAGK